MYPEYTQQNDEDKVIAILLSGGKGQRMGGRDKGLIDLRGQRLIEGVIQRIAPQVNDIVISVNRNHEQYTKLGYALISDSSNEQGRFQGPLAGISSVLQTYADNAGYFLICTCDSPNLPNNYVARLKQQLIQTNSVAAVVSDGTAVQNLHCLISSQASSSLIDFFNNGGRAMYRWLAQSKVVEVDFSAEAAAFANYNTPESIN